MPNSLICHVVSSMEIHSIIPLVTLLLNVQDAKLVSILFRSFCSRENYTCSVLVVGILILADIMDIRCMKTSTCFVKAYAS